MTDLTLFVSVGAILILLVLLVFQWKRIKYFKKLSETDRLTSLPNYSYLEKILRGIILRKSLFSIAIIDIDNFRTYNKHSYKLGDDVMVEFCSRLREFLPDASVLARFRMGDEFVILFENTDFQQAQTIITSVKKQFESYNFICLQGFPETTVTFSEGIIQNDPAINNIEALFCEAEKLLKLQKQAQQGE
jgi:diguanylate cyclase (GGDEF)-like protein